MTLQGKMNQVFNHNTKHKFKNFAKLHGLAKYNNVDYYFDGDSVIDAITDTKIPHIICNGTMTWHKVFIALKRFYKLIDC